MHAAHLAGMDEHIISDGVVERLWTLDDLAAFLRVPKDTIRTWSKHGEGPKGYKVGRHVRFKASDVERWLESRDPAVRSVDLHARTVTGRRGRAPPTTRRARGVWPSVGELAPAG